MPPALVDSSVLLDVFENDPVWAAWSTATLDQFSYDGALYMNPIVYSEISIGFKAIEELEAVCEKANLLMLEIPREALYLAGKAFLSYRRSGGAKIAPLPDFLIGAHASVINLPLITRDPKRVRTNFPRVKLITPKTPIWR